MNEREELRMIRERIEQAQDALACGTLALLLVAAWALLRLVALAG